MKKKLTQLLRKTGEKAAVIPEAARCMPGKMYQPAMPKSLQAKVMGNK